MKKEAILLPLSFVVYLVGGLVEVTGVVLGVEEWKVSRGLNELVLHPAGPAGGH